MTMRSKPNFAEAVERMRRLWNLEAPLDRVPAAVRLPAPAPPRGLEFVTDGTFFGDLPGYLAHEEERHARQSGVPDEWFPTVCPRYGHALIATLCGSPLRAQAETTWSTPIIQNWSPLDKLGLDFENEWGRRYRSDLETLLDWAAGRCAVSVYEVEGISDTMSALRGAERLCFDFADAPDEVHRFAGRVTDILIAFGKWQAEHVEAKQDLLGGCAVDWRLWMPAGSICTAEDASVLFGRDRYREFIKEEARRLTASFTRTLLEVHAEGVHQLPEFGDVEGVSMMTIQNPLRMAPEHRDTVRQLLGRKAFYIPCATEEVEDLLAFTGTRGVYVVTNVNTTVEARQFLRDLEKWTAKLSGTEE